MPLIGALETYKYNYSVTHFKNKENNPQNFGTDPAGIRIRINPAIRIRIPDHFRLKFWSWRRFALSEHSLVVIFYV